MKLTHAKRLSKNGLALRKCLPAFAIVGTFNAQSLYEIHRRTFQGDAVERLRQSGFERDYCVVGVQ